MGRVVFHPSGTTVEDVDDVEMHASGKWLLLHRNEWRRTGLSNGRPGSTEYFLIEPYNRITFIADRRME